MQNQNFINTAMNRGGSEQARSPQRF